ncbi:DUF2786 domain-containing protein [Yinghuangia soli]|uniref:DUF2786 domain-containing protein n=1 Tax=Yinghuangia soli TaxID=2908204 RepID=A0AA41Q0A5_9ACTN|nr:DUF2786 domain-containing protein [Yinghuangia soli]MCF2528411.1 DUF2786 domain-containing protein [Yinghuangia soli]
MSSAPSALLDEILHGLLAATGDDAVQAVVDSGASRLAAEAEVWPDASRAYLALAERVAAGCWARGWQPADVVRMAARAFADERPADRHLRIAVDLVAAAQRRESATRGARWARQIRDAGAEVWWDDDSAYLSAVAARENLTRFECAGYALEVLRLLARLPGITPLHAEAAESAPRPARGTRGAEGEPPRMLARIRALLAKAESTEFPEEAEALSAKAQELMARHSIDAALLAADGGAGRPGGTPGAVRIGVESPYDEAKAMLLDAVAEANRCRTVWSPEFGFSTVIGFDPDLDAVELLYTSLLVQATGAMTRAGGRSRGGRSRNKSGSRDFRQSFLIAYADRIGERLAAAAERAEKEAAREAAAASAPEGGAEAGTGSDDRLLPVLAGRDVAVQEATEEMFPTLTTHRVRIRDEEGWVHGKAAADQATLQPRAVGRRGGH